MKRNWNDIKWIFEPDGGLIDIYVQEVSLNEWEKIIDLINKKYKVNFGDAREKIDKQYVIEYLRDEKGEIEYKIASIVLGTIKLNCHFFLEDQIEFDIDPAEINSIEDFILIESFMIDISKLINNQITLTSENNPEFPLAKIDVNRGINRILTEDEAMKYWKNQNSISKKFNLFKDKMKFKFFPKQFKEKILKSANEPYKSTRKNKNVW